MSTHGTPEGYEQGYDAGYKAAPLPPVVKGVLIAYYSARDRAGNCQWAFAYTDTQTGDTACGRISGGESNIHAIRLELNGGQWPSNPAMYLHATIELPIREFKGLVSDWPYAGCHPKELADYVRKSLAHCDALRQAAKHPQTIPPQD